MRRRLLTLVCASIILLMVLPPLCNTFDTWDKGAELPLVGHDMETTLTEAAFDAGLGVAVAWSAICLLVLFVMAAALEVIGAEPLHALIGVRATEFLLWLFSPPRRVVSLRI